MLPMQNVKMACVERVRCVNELGAVGSFVRPNAIDGHLAFQLLESTVRDALRARRRDGFPRRHRRPGATAI